MSGYCLIPCENVKQYGKVIKRLKKAKLEWDEELVDTEFTALIWNPHYRKDEPEVLQVKQPVQPMIRITWRKP